MSAAYESDRESESEQILLSAEQQDVEDAVDIDSKQQKRNKQNSKSQETNTDQFQPKNQILLPQSDPHSFNQERALTHASKQHFQLRTRLDEIQQEWAEAIYPVAVRMYKGCVSEGSAKEVAQNLVIAEGKSYKLTYEVEKNTLSLATNDGRGELIRYRGKTVEYAASLTRIDLDKWKAIEQQLDEIERQIKSAQGEQQRHERSKGIDLEL